MSSKDYIAISKVPALIMEIAGVARTKNAVYAWATLGRISADGRLVKMKTVKRMGRMYTTREWVDKFVRAVG